MAKSGFTSYRSTMRSNFTALWSGAWIANEFEQAMMDALDRGYMAAWAEGAAEVGISKDELSEEEMTALYGFLSQALLSLPGATADVEAHSKANGGKYAYAMNRAELWAQQYQAMVNEAKTRAGANRKLRWDLGATEVHCRDCLRYSGRVYRASTWARWDIRPQHPRLACGGFRCDCRLVPTDEPANKGRPPRMTG